MRNDTFDNLALIGVTEPAANTLTFQKLESGLEIMSGKAWVISRLEYYLGAILAGDFNASGDLCQFGVSQTTAFTVINPHSNLILDYNLVFRTDMGVAASSLLATDPLIIKDYSGLKGGGLVVVPNPFYAWVKGTGLVNPMTLNVRMFYSQIEVKDSEFYELFQSRVFLTA